MAYAVSRPAELALVVELPGVDVTRLKSSYAVVGSALVEGVEVEPQGSVGGLRAGVLFVKLRSGARERTRIEGNNLVLEFAPDPAAAAQQQRPAPMPAPPISTRIADAEPQQIQISTPSQQGQRYGQTGFIGEPINLNVVNADIRDILNYITEQYGVNFVIDKSVGAVPVTVNVTEVPWNLALDAILRANRLGIDVNGNILRVSTQQVLADEAATQAKIADARLNNSPLVTEIFRLNYSRASGTLAQQAGSTGNFSGGNSGGEGFNGGTGGDAARDGSDQGILPIISRRLSRRGSVEVDGRSNTLLVTDVRENIELNIRPLIALLDQPEPQVEIETRIVIATRNFSRDLGVQLAAAVFSLGTNPDGSRFLNRGGTFNTIAGSPLGGGAGGGNNPIGFRPGGLPQGIGIEPSGLGANVPSSVIGLTTGLIGTAQISALITAAETKGQAKVVATPRLTVLNNRPGQIESGSQIPVVTPQGGSAAGDAVVFTTTFVSVPIRLSVTPQITDAGTVILRVVAESNTVDRSLTNSLGTPCIDTQRMQTEVLVPDGGTTVVGGVLNDSEGETQARTPGLSGIPVIGNLFKRKATVRNTNEVLFFITPRIYRPDYNGRPTSSTVSSATRTATIPQPVPLGNPQSNTPAPASSQPTAVVPPAAPPASDQIPPAREQR